MNLIENFRQSLSAIVVNKKRSVLTMLGIIIGLTAVTTIVSIGDTISDVTNGFISSMFKSNVIFVYIDEAEDEDEVSSDITSYYIKNEEIDEIIKNAPESVLDIMDPFGESYSGKASKGKDDFSEVTVVPASPGNQILDINDPMDDAVCMLEGRFLSRKDCDEEKPVVVISDITARNCFGSEKNAIGKTLPIDIEYYEYQSEKMAHMNIEFAVVGVYEYVDKYQRTNNIKDIRLFKTKAFVPNTYLNNQLEDETADYINEVGTPLMVVVAKDSFCTEDAMMYFEKVMSKRFEGDEEYLYNIEKMVPDESTEMIDKMIFAITAVFTLIAATSLIVGGIGLMNTMLVSVTERTKEIGIKKALGAKKSTIRKQFLIESAIICLIACAVGIVFSMTVNMVIENSLDDIIALIKEKTLRYYLENTQINIDISLSAVVVSTFFSVLVGIVFGMYPANKGAKMQPVDALRYE